MRERAFARAAYAASAHRCLHLLLPSVEGTGAGCFSMAPRSVAGRNACDGSVHVLGHGRARWQVVLEFGERLKRLLLLTRGVLQRGKVEVTVRMSSRKHGGVELL